MTDFVKIFFKVFLGIIIALIILALIVCPFGLAWGLACMSGNPLWFLLLLSYIPTTALVIASIVWLAYKL